MANEENGFTFIDEPPAASPPQEGGFRFFDESELEPKQLTGRALAEDVGRSALAKGVQGAVGTMMGAPGSIETFVAKDVPEIGRSLFNAAREKLDLISPSERMAAEKTPLYSDQTEMQKKGYASPITHSPTYKGVTEAVKDVGPKLGAPQLAYEPQSSLGKVVGVGTEMATQGLPGAARTLPGRVATGFGAGAGSEALGLYNEGTEGEGMYRVLGALGGGLATAKIANAVRATMLPGGIQDELAQAISADISRGKANMTPEQLKELASSGAPVSVYDLGGPETRKLLSRYAEMSPKNQELASDFNAFLNERALASGSRVSENLKSVMGGPIDAVALTEATEKAGQLTRNNVYDLARANPLANAIPEAAIGSDLLNRPLIQKAMREAEINAKNAPQWNIVPPKSSAGSPPVATGIVDASGQPIMSAGVPAASTPGNLSYWDQVKRELDGKISAAERSGETAEAAALRTAKTDLVSRLDKIVPEYATARDTASETFKAASAPEAGYKFITTTNDFKLQDIKKAMATYSPEQRELFAVGVANRIQQMALEGRTPQLANKFLTDSRFQDRMKLALGDERFAAIKGNVIAENLLQKTQELKFLQSGITPERAGLVAGAGTAATEIFANMIAGVPLVSPELAGKALAVGTVAGAGKFALSKMEKSIAERVLPLATSQNPKDIATIGELATRYPVVEQLLNKFTTTLSAAVTQAEKFYGNSEARPTRASGGRIGGNHEADADKLIARIKKAHADHQNETSTLLRSDDTIVAKALELAHRNI